MSNKELYVVTDWNKANVVLFEATSKNNALLQYLSDIGADSIEVPDNIDVDYRGATVNRPFVEKEVELDNLWSKSKMQPTYMLARELIDLWHDAEVAKGVTLGYLHDANHELRIVKEYEKEQTTSIINLEEALVAAQDGSDNLLDSQDEEIAEWKAELVEADKHIEKLAAELEEVTQQRDLANAGNKQLRAELWAAQAQADDNEESADHYAEQRNKERARHEKIHGQLSMDLNTANLRLADAVEEANICRNAIQHLRKQFVTFQFKGEDVGWDVPWGMNLRVVNRETDEIIELEGPNSWGPNEG